MVVTAEQQRAAKQQPTHAMLAMHDEMMEAFQEAEKHHRPRYFQHKRNHLTTQDV